MSELPDPMPANLDQTNVPTHVHHQWPMLEAYAQELAARYGAAIYLVGSALVPANSEPRDWDVRCILPDDVFERAYGPLKEWAQVAPFSATRTRWAADCAKQTSLGWSICPGLYIDFQVLPESQCRRDHAKPRVRLDADINRLDPSGYMGAEPIHTYFGLSYASHLVLNRTLLQSMPTDWQQRFVACLYELNQAFAHIEAPRYRVETGEWHYPNELSEDQLKALGWEYNDAKDEIYGPAGENHDPNTQCVFIAKPEPIPHYQRGRTRLEPYAQSGSEA